MVTQMMMSHIVLPAYNCTHTDSEICDVIILWFYTLPFVSTNKLNVVLRECLNQRFPSFSCDPVSNICTFYATL